MKKYGWIIILLRMVLYFSSYIHTDTKTLLRGLNVIEKVEIQNLEIPISETKERHIYNEEDDEKNRFLQFLNDEIPLVGYDVYTNPPETVYASEIYMGDSENNLMPDKYCVTDMDGDGENEFCFYSWLVLNIIKYDHAQKVFTLWLDIDWNYKPLRTGEMYAIVDGDYVPATRSWIYESYDKDGNHLLTNLYSMIWQTQEEIQYTVTENMAKWEDIQREIVTEKEWTERRAYLIDLIEDAPEWITYEDLFNR